MKLKTTKEFEEELKTKAPHLTLLSEYTNSNTRVLVQDNLNIIYSCLPGMLLKYANPSLQTAVDKNKAFETKAKLVHGDLYDYSKVNYITNSNKVTIICYKHGEFQQTPRDHLVGYKCKKCGYDSNRISYDKFIKRADKLHNSKYTYKNLSYKLITEKINITCPIHGDFEQTVDSHMQGSGCPKCGKKLNPTWSKTKWIQYCNSKISSIPIVYIVRCFNDKENFIKIGITANSIHKRFLSNIPYSYEVIKEIKGSPDFIWDKEKELHRKFKKFKYIPKLPFGGQTECFTLDILNHIS